MPVRSRHLAAAVAVALVLLGGGAAAAGAVGLARDPVRCNGMARLCDRTLDRVVLAGAHNAMSAADLGWRLPNQTVAIPQQLALGIRALLVDAHYGRLQPDGTVATDDDGSAPPGPRGTYLCHVACSLGATPLDAGLRGVGDWVRANPDNVLVIVVEDAITPADLVSAVRRSGLSRFVYRGGTDRWPTLRRMIRTRQQVVILAERQGGAAPWYHPAYAGILQETPYTFKTPGLLLDPANLPASCAPNRGGTTGSLFLMNHWSPDVPPPVPDLVTAAFVNAPATVIARFRACTRLRGKRPTIVAGDQITAGDDALIRAVRRLNR